MNDSTILGSLIASGVVSAQIRIAARKIATLYCSNIQSLSASKIESPQP
jgi:hypothetical protein